MKKESTEESAVQDSDHLNSDFSQNPSRRKQRCPRPVKVKRGRPRKRTAHSDTASEPPKRTYPRRRSAQAKEIAKNDVQDEISDHKEIEDKEEEEQETIGDDKSDPEFVVSISFVKYLDSKF